MYFSGILQKNISYGSAAERFVDIFAVYGKDGQITMDHQRYAFTFKDFNILCLNMLVFNKMLQN